MKIEKIKIGYPLDDPDIFCSECKEISGGSIEWDKDINEAVILAYCGCFICTLDEYNKANLSVNYEVDKNGNEN